MGQTFSSFLKRKLTDCGQHGSHNGHNLHAMVVSESSDSDREDSNEEERKTLAENFDLTDRIAPITCLSICDSMLVHAYGNHHIHRTSRRTRPFPYICLYNKILSPHHDPCPAAVSCPLCRITISETLASLSLLFRHRGCVRAFSDNLSSSNPNLVDGSVCAFDVSPHSTLNHPTYHFDWIHSHPKTLNSYALTQNNNIPEHSLQKTPNHTS